MKEKKEKRVRLSMKLLWIFANDMREKETLVASIPNFLHYVTRRMKESEPLKP